MFEQTFKNIDDILHKDAGCGETFKLIFILFKRPLFSGLFLLNSPVATAEREKC